MKKCFAWTTVLALVLSLVVPISVLADSPESAGPQPIYRDDGTIDIGPVLRAKDLPIEGLENLSAAEFQSLYSIRAQTYDVGDEMTFLALNDYTGRYFFTTYTVMTITDNAEVWVQNDLNYYNLDGSPNPLHPDAKDPEYVTEARINELAARFDQVIQPTDTQFYGMYDSLDGTYSLLDAWGYVTPGYYEGDGTRVIILVSNVRDDNFYDPIHSGSFIAGFYSPTFEAYSDRNMITIDSKQWNDRVGDSGHPTRSYTYDSTLAHELQHLIHDDYSPSEDSWVNEAMSEFAEFLVGFRTEDTHSRTQWQTWPENSLILWGDQPGEILADYQMGYLFAMYTTGMIGGVYTDTAKLTQQEKDGILGFNAWLTDISATNPDAVGLDFETLFAGFRKAMLNGGTTDGAGPIAEWNSDFISSYVSPLETSGGAPTSELYLGRMRDNLDIEGYSTEGVPPFGTDFIEILWSQQIADGAPWTISFDGDESAPPSAWEAITATEIYTPSGNVSGDVLYSGHTDLTDNFVVFGPITPTVSDQLTFDQYYNIEDEWDYGFVQVTTDLTGMTGWTSLDMPGMITGTDTSAHPIIVANVPGFSGFSGGWITATYDLGAEYAGQGILVAFRYSTDWATGGSDEDYPAGWAIDNVQFGTLRLSGVNNGMAGRSIQQVRGAGNRFSVEFLTWGDGDTVDVSNVYTMALSAAMTGTMDLPTMDTAFDQAGERGVLMVSLMLNTYTDLINGGILPAYGDYALWNLPPSIGTSTLYAFGREGSRVYAGEPVTATIYADNLGASPNLTTTAPITFYIGVEIPDDTAYVTGSATGGAAYTADLSTVSAKFPAQPGIYWTGLVTDTYLFDTSFATDEDLVTGDTVVVTVHYADGVGTDQYFTDTAQVNVASAFGLSAMQADVDPVFPGKVAEFSTVVINKSENAKEIQLVAPVPTDTTFITVTGAANVVTGSDAVTITQVISPYADAGPTTFTFEWQLGPSYDFGDTITSEVALTDLLTDETFPLSATADVDASYWFYLPVVWSSGSYALRSGTTLP